METEVLLMRLNKTLESDVPDWLHVAVLEIIRCFFLDRKLIQYYITANQF